MKHDGCIYKGERIESCLACPLDMCQFEITTRERFKVVRDKRVSKEEVVRLMQENLTQEEIARRFGVSARTIQRRLDEKDC